MFHRELKKMLHVTFAVIMIMLSTLILSACFTKQGTIYIVHNNDTSFTVEMKEYNSTETCKLSLNEDDIIQVQVEHEEGIIYLTVRGSNGSEPYTGNDLATGIFTFRVTETSEHTFSFRGNFATGKILIKKLWNNTLFC